MFCEWAICFRRLYRYDRFWGEFIIDFAPLHFTNCIGRRVKQTGVEVWR